MSLWRLHVAFGVHLCCSSEIIFTLLYLDWLKLVVVWLSFTAREGLLDGLCRTTLIGRVNTLPFFRLVLCLLSSSLKSNFIGALNLSKFLTVFATEFSASTALVGSKLVGQFLQVCRISTRSVVIKLLLTLTFISDSDLTSGWLSSGDECLSLSISFYMLSILKKVRSLLASFQSSLLKSILCSALKSTSVFASSS